MEQTPSPLERLVALARKDRKFFKLLLTNPTAGFKAAKEKGVSLSAKEKAFVRKLVRGQAISIPLGQITASAAGSRQGPIPFWDILCKLFGKKGYK